MKSRSILVFVFCYLITATVHADLADARDARARGDLETAAQEYRRLAEAGNAAAQAHLGYMYYAGEGVDQDYGRAVAWYRKAADQGNADAQYNLAVAYAFGEGVEQDYASAVEWYRKAAGQGHTVAQYSLGLSYAYGEGVQQDYDQAERWYRMAADQGYADARMALDDLQRARAEAAPAEDLPERSAADTEQGNEFLDMNGIEPSLPRSQQQPGEDLLAVQTTPAVTGAEADHAATDAGEAAAATTEADGNTAGDAAKPAPARDDKGKKKKSFLQRLFGSDEDGGNEAADSGSETAADAAGQPGAEQAPEHESNEQSPPAQADATGTSDDVVMETGAAAGDESGPETDSGTEKKQPGFFKRLFSKSEPESSTAAAQPQTGDRDAVDETADTEVRDYDPQLYEQAVTALDNNDYDTAVDTLQEAAGQGDPRAQYRLGSLYYQGLGVSQSYSEALYWYRRSARGGNADAQYSLGNMYFMGEGVEQNDRRAGFWYEKAADQGHSSARHNLSNLERIMDSSGEPQDVIKGEEPSTDKESDSGNDNKKRGFFERLFDKEEEKKTVTAGAAAGDDAENETVTPTEKTTTQPEAKDSTAAGDTPRKSDAVLHKDSGGLFGFLFGDEDDEDGDEQQQADGSRANTGQQEQAAASQPEQEPNTEDAGDTPRKSDAVLHKDSGGLFGFLFGDDDDEEEDKQQQADGSRANTGQEEQAAAPADSTDRTREQHGDETVHVPAAAVQDYQKGMAYLFGDGVEKDPVEAFNYFEQSAQQGYPPAQYRLGVAYAYGEGTEQDKRRAAHWYEQAAVRGHTIAQRNLGVMYLQGEGVEQNKIQALAWYSIVAEGGKIMDIRRRDDLIRELSPEQIEESHYLKTALKTEIESNGR